MAWESGFDLRHLAHWRVCLGTAGASAACEEQTLPNASFGILPAGAYTVQVTGVSDSGAVGPTTELEVVVDATGPMLGGVHVGEPEARSEAAYWSEQEEVRPPACTCKYMRVCVCVSMCVWSHMRM